MKTRRVIIRVLIAAGLTITIITAFNSWLQPATSTFHHDELRDVPDRYRNELLANLDRFDRLPSESRLTIQAIDESVATLEGESRSKALELLNRYGDWFRSLDPDDQRALQEAEAPDERLGLIREILEDNRSENPAGLTILHWTRSKIFNPIPIHDALYLLGIWVRIDEEIRREFELQWQRGAASPYLLVSLEDRPPDQLSREITQAFLEEADRSRTMENRSSARGSFGQGNSLQDLFERLPRFPRQNRFSGGNRAEQNRRFEMGNQIRFTALRVIETTIMQKLRRQGPWSSTESLMAIEARLPDWYRETLDPLPPSVLRLRLEALKTLASLDPKLDAWLLQGTEA